MLGLTFSDSTLKGLVETMGVGVQWPTEPATIVTANLDHIVMLTRNADFRQAYRNAAVRTIDGAPVYVWSRFRGNKSATRVPGSDLFKAFMDTLPQDGARVFFVVPDEGVGEALTDLLVARGMPPNSIAWHCPPFGFEKEDSATAALIAAIKDIDPTHIFFGVGAPRSEIWADQNRAHLPPAWILACGASLEFYVGFKERAPKWMREAGLEWLHRLLSEPKRLAKRYLVNSWSFLWALVLDLRGVDLFAPPDQGIDPN